MMKWRFYMHCPRCDGQEVLVLDDKHMPRERCLDCATERVEIVEMRVVCYEPIPVFSQ